MIMLRCELGFLLRLAAAFTLLIAAVYWGYSVERAVVRANRPHIRICAVLIIVLWTSTALFHLLAAWRAFTLSWGIFVWAALSLLTLARCRRHAVAPLLSARRDLAWIRNLLHVRFSALYRLFVPFSLMLMLLVAARSLWLPPVTWDALTYHAVKAGLWVQQSHLALFPSPGGWGEHYRTFLGGGEVFFAWAMLPFHSDFLANLLDAMLWAANALACYSLARTLHMRAAMSWTVAAYVVSIPALCSAAGAMYVDNLVLLAVTLGLLFAVRFRRSAKMCDALLSLAALGIAAGAKLTIWPAVGFGMAAIAWFSLRHRRTRSGTPLLLATGAAAVAVTVLPWLILNWSESGTVIGDFPLHIGKLVLGKASPATLFLEHSLATARDSDISGLRNVLRNALRAPWIPGIHLSVMSLLPAGLGILAFLRWKRTIHSKDAAFLGLASLSSAAPLFILTSFRQLAYAWSNTFSRFLTPAAVPFMILGVSSMCAGRLCTTRSNRTLGIGLWIGAGIHLSVHAFYGWSLYDFKAFALLLMVGAMTAGIAAIRRRFTPRLWIPVIAAVAFVLWPMRIYRDRHRYKLLMQSLQLHNIPRDISLCAQAIDKPDHPFQVAVTAGTWPDEDNWMLYYFLGSRLQNDLHYVPITKDGSIVDLPPLSRDDPRLDPTRWRRRLANQHIEAIMAFWPEPIEIRWMEDDPSQFERLAGLYPQWGLYWVRPRPDDTFWRFYRN